MKNLKQDYYLAGDLENFLSIVQAKNIRLKIETGIDELDNQKEGAECHFRIKHNNDETIIRFDVLAILPIDGEDLLVIDIRAPMVDWLLDKINDGILPTQNDNGKIDSIELEFRQPSGNEEKNDVDCRVHFYNPKLLVSAFRSEPEAIADFRFIASISEASIHHRLRKE